MCLSQGHNAVTPVRFEPAAPRSRVKDSINESLRSLDIRIIERTSYPQKVNSMDKKRRTTILARDTPSRPDLHAYQILSKYLKGY